LAFPGKGLRIPEEYSRYVLCRKMGWDYYTYNAQPAFFVEQIADCINAEEKSQKIKEAKQQKNGR